MEITIARILHILGVVIWIGGVAMVTLVILPAVKRMKSKEEQLHSFEQIEGRFANIAKFATVVTGLSGLYMILELNAWYRFLDYRYWWMHAMVLVWFIFSLILFVLEPFLLHKVFRERALKNPQATFRFIHRAHWVLLIISLITIIGAMAGSHGLYFFT